MAKKEINTVVEEPAVEVRNETKVTEVAPMSKSARIRELLAQGKTITEVAEEVGVRYNFVYNVASRFMDELPTQRQQGESKSAQVRELLDQGKAVTEVKKALGLDYNFVYSVKQAYDRKKARDAKEAE